MFSFQFQYLIIKYPVYHSKNTNTNANANAIGNTNENTNAKQNKLQSALDIIKNVKNYKLLYNFNKRYEIKAYTFIL